MIPKPLHAIAESDILSQLEWLSGPAELACMAGPKCCWHNAASAVWKIPVRPVRKTLESTGCIGADDRCPQTDKTDKLPRRSYRLRLITVEAWNSTTVTQQSQQIGSLSHCLSNGAPASGRLQALRGHGLLANIDVGPIGA